MYARQVFGQLRGFQGNFFSVEHTLHTGGCFGRPGEFRAQRRHLLHTLRVFPGKPQGRITAHGIAEKTDFVYLFFFQKTEQGVFKQFHGEWPGSSNAAMSGQV